jgi:hypothetical protein
MRGKRKLRIAPRPPRDYRDDLVLALAQPRWNPAGGRLQGHSLDEIRGMSAARKAVLLAECDPVSVCLVKSILKRRQFG